MASDTGNQFPGHTFQYKVTLSPGVIKLRLLFLVFDVNNPKYCTLLFRECFR